jgi:hypothetical protein
LSTCKAMRVQNGTKAPKTVTNTSDHTMPYPGNSGTFPKNQCDQMGTQERVLSSFHTFSEVLLWEIFRRRKCINLIWNISKKNGPCRLSVIGYSFGLCANMAPN